MKRFSWLCSGLLLLAICTEAEAAYINSAADPALAGSTLIDFEAASAGSFETETFGGVSFKSLVPGKPLSVSDFYNGNYGTIGKSLGTNDQLSFSSPLSFRIDFANVVSAFGFSWGAADEAWSLTVFDDSNNSLGNFFTPTGTSFVGVSGSRISYAILSTTLQGSQTDNALLDNLRYVEDVTTGPGPTPTPEPGTLALMAFGAMGLAAGKYRKKKKAA